MANSEIDAMVQHCHRTVALIESVLNDPKKVEQLTREQVTMVTTELDALQKLLDSYFA
jgi:hypothetical protein